MIEVELLGRAAVRQAPPAGELRRLCAESARARGVSHGHVAIEFVAPARIAALNAEHRGRHAPTDVLSFPIDGAPADADADADAGAGATAGAKRSLEDAAVDGGLPRELGDIVICPEHTADVREAVVHGMLHLLGMDHEIDAGEMLALQDEILAAAR
jgi:probable rRNA maturation factor